MRGHDVFEFACCYAPGILKSDHLFAGGIKQAFSFYFCLEAYV